MGQPITVVNAFTDRRFAGNPAAVCVLDAPADEGWMKLVAREMNLSETAFLHPEADGHRLRWFTPAAEVDLCGHATLATAHVLWERGILPADRPARFQTRSGLLVATKLGDWIELDFPAKLAEPVDPPAELLKALGVAAVSTLRNAFDYLVEIASADILRSLRPDFTALAALPVRGVIVTCGSDTPDYDFLSRFFAPAVGVPEDPVTGSAHCALGPFWGARLGRTSLVGYQVSERGGVIRIRCDGDRVHLGGQAVTAWRGELA